MSKKALAADKNSPACKRLAQALATLTRQRKAAGTSDKPTVAELCRLAGVSRNSLYRYHAGVLKSMREQQRKWRNAQPSPTNEHQEHLRAEVGSLRKQMAKFTALIDHYYAAYREANTLLTRRDRELAELRRRLNSKPVTLPRGRGVAVSP